MYYRILLTDFLNCVYSRTRRTLFPSSHLIYTLANSQVELPGTSADLCCWTQARLITKRAPHQLLLTTHPPTLSQLIWPGHHPDTKPLLWTFRPLATHSVTVLSFTFPPSFFLTQQKNQTNNHMINRPLGVGIYSQFSNNPLIGHSRPLYARLENWKSVIYCTPADQQNWLLNCANVLLIGHGGSAGSGWLSK